MGRRTVVLAGLVTALLAGAVALAVAATRRAAPHPAAIGGSASAARASEGLPVLWQVPAFSFPDQNARSTSAKDLRNHVWIADFVFTRCTTICPLITAKMALLQRRLKNPNLRFVSFSVDPARDDPETLKRYADDWRPGESRWLLFSTTPSGLANLAAAMFVDVEPGKNDIGHTNLFFLVDGRGGVRGIYESDKDDAVERLVRDAETLSGAAPADTSPPRVASTGSELYAALGCGACHARAELAPPLEGLAGRRVELAGDAGLVADGAYVRESIVAPNAKLVAGYSLRMPSYAGELTPRELELLVEHVENLASAPAASATTTPVAKPVEPVAKPAESAALAVDPVCSMDVRVVASTPHASHAGRSYYFCSEMCRDRFVAEPTRYAPKR